MDPISSGGTINNPRLNLLNGTGGDIQQLNGAAGSLSVGPTATYQAAAKPAQPAEVPTTPEPESSVNPSPTPVPSPQSSASESLTAMPAVQPAIARHMDISRPIAAASEQSTPEANSSQATSVPE